MTSENIEESFTKLATTIKHKVEDGIIPEDFVLIRKKEEKDFVLEMGGDAD